MHGLPLALGALTPLILALSVSHGWATEAGELAAEATLPEQRCQRVLRDLEQPPNGRHGAGKAVEIRLNLHVLDILAVDDAAGTFTGDVLMFVSWNDPRFADREISQQIRGCELQRGQLWEPPLHLANGYDSSTVPVDPLAVSATGVVSYRERIRATFSTRFDLHDFPFDRQSFEIAVISTAPSDLVRFGSTIDFRDGQFASVGWRFSNPMATNSSYEQPYGIGDPRNRQVPLAIFSFEGHRRAEFYLWRIVLPLCLIVAMSWSVFWIHSSELGTQMSVSSASVLTLIAFQISLTDMLPAVPYLTRLDAFALTATVLVFAALAESVSSSWLVRRNKVALAELIDRSSRIVFPAAFVAVIAVLSL